MHRWYWSVLAACFLPAATGAETVELHVPIVEDSPQQHHYFHDLLETALRKAGHEPKLVTHRLPQLRIKKYLADGRISVFWMLETEARNRRFPRIDVDLTKGFIGHRTLLIHPKDQSKFNDVQTLDDFRELGLVAGLGEGWFDIDVWHANDLPYRIQPGNWKVIFQKVAKRRDYDYFPRGANEIVDEAAAHPNLTIEENLALIYDRDFQFYLSATGPATTYTELLREALTRAQAGSTIDKLVRKHWSGNLEILNLDQRRTLRLKTPN